MATRKPLVLADGRIKELPSGDSIDADVITVGFEIDGGNASTTYEGVPAFDFGSAT